MECFHFHSTYFATHPHPHTNNVSLILKYILYLISFYEPLIFVFISLLRERISAPFQPHRVYNMLPLYSVLHSTQYLEQQMMLFLCNSLMFMYLCLTTLGVVRSPYTISKYFEMVILYMFLILLLFFFIFIFHITSVELLPYIRLLHEYTGHITNIEHTYIHTIMIILN